MASNLSVNVTADATQLNVAMAAAKATIKDYQAAVTAAGKEMASAGAASQPLLQAVEDTRVKAAAAKAAVADLSGGLRTTQTAAAAATAGLQQVATGAEHAAGSTAVMREVIVMAHEAIQGRFSRLGGSMMVVAEHTGAVTSVMSIMTGGMWAAVAGAAALAGGLAYLAIQASSATRAMQALDAVTGMQGRDSDVAAAHVRASAAAMRQLGISATDARTVSIAIEEISSVSAQTRQRLQGMGADLSLFFTRSGVESDKLGEKFRETFSNVADLQRFALANNMLTASQQQAVEEAKKRNDTDAAYGVLLDGLAARSQYVALQQKNSDDAAWEAIKLRMAGVTAQTNNLMQAYDQAGAAAIQFRTKLQFPGQATADMMPAAPTEEWKTKIEQAATEAGDKAVTAAAASGAKRTAIVEAETKAEMQVYQQASLDMSRSDTERNAMAARAIQLHMTLVKEDAGASESAARAASAAQRRSAEEVIASYAAQEAEARGDLAKIEAIEREKLAYIAGIYGQQSTQYQRALAERQSALRTAMQTEITDTKQAGTQEIADRKAELQLEEAQHKITKTNEMAAEIAFSDQVHAEELKRVDALISTLQAGTSAYATAMRDRHNLDVQFQLEHIQMLKQLQQAENEASAKDMQEWNAAFSSIGSAGRSSIAGLITGRETMLQAEQRVASAVVDAGVNMLTHWVAVELAKTLATDAGTAARVAAEQAEGNTGLGVILAHWLGLETAKTATTTAGAATRTAADTSGGLLSRIGTILASWLGLETGKTAATTAGAATRTAADTASALAGGTAQATAARLQVAAAAAVAAAWAFADSAELGPPGLAAAPAAAASAEATVMGFQGLIPGLAAGTSYVPRDMVANIHQGEMVVPKFDADLIRGGAGAGHTFNYAPTINGVGGSLERQIQQQHDDFKGFIWQMTRNGQLSLPGRAQRPT